VDCTQDNAKKLCEKYGVSSYPTIKYFSNETAKLGDTYEGKREFDSLKKFVKSYSKAPCDHITLNNCNKQEKDFIKEAREWNGNRVTKWYTDSRDEVSAARGAEGDLAERVERMQKEVMDLMEKQEKAKKKTDETILRNTRKAKILATMLGPKKEEEEEDDPDL